MTIIIFNTIEYTNLFGAGRELLEGIATLLATRIEKLSDVEYFSIVELAFNVPSILYHFTNCSQ
jgi:hypothetical protein